MRFRYINKGQFPANYLYFSGNEERNLNSVKYRESGFNYIQNKQLLSDVVLIASSEYGNFTGPV